MGLLNPKNFGTAAGDLGVAALLNPDAVDEMDRKKKEELQKQREALGLTGVSVYGGEASKLLGIPLIGG